MLMSDDWTELYRPKALQDVIGNPKAIQELRGWADAWQTGHPKKRAVVLIGPPGIGKTSAALALAEEYAWGLVEMNASDQRNADAIKRVALRGAYSDTFTDTGEYLSSKDGHLKLIVLDEADNLFGREDRGAVPVIVNLIKETRQPVILIVNDFYGLSRKSSAIKHQTLQIRFQKPRMPSIRAVIRRIAKDQGIEICEAAIDAIADNANGDLRAAVRDFQSIALGRANITEEDAMVLEDRLASKSTYDLMGATLTRDDPTRARSIMRDVDETPDHILLWLDENLPSSCNDPGDLTRGYSMLSRADIFMGRVHRRQYYRFWAYASDLMTFGVCASKRNRSKGYGRFRFPSYLVKMSRSKGQRALKRSVCRKIGSHTHNSTGRVREDVLPYLREMSRNDPDLAIALVRELGLDADEVAFLLMDTIDSARVKVAMGESITSSKATVEVKPEKEVRSKGDPINQRSLFEY